MCRVLGLGFKFFGYLGLGLVWVVSESVGNFEKASLGQFLCFKFLIRFSLKKIYTQKLKKNFCVLNYLIRYLQEICKIPKPNLFSG